MQRLLAVGIGLLLLGGMAHAITVDGDLSDWGNWGAWNSDHSVFDSTAYAFTANSDVQLQSTWSTENNHHTPATLISSGVPWTQTQMDSSSGGEWYDIEGLYIDTTDNGDGTATLSWAIITSDPGMAPGEAGGSTTYSAERDSGGYHRLPVIGLSLDGDVNNGYECALVLGDSSPVVQSGSDPGFGDLGTMGATLYSGLSEANWTTGSSDWVRGSDFLQPVDVRYSSLTADNVVASTGTTLRNEMSGEHPENNRMIYGQSAAYWDLAYNYVWEGSITFNASAITWGSAVSAGYGMYCGNDYVTVSSQEGILIKTPELGTWALLSCSLVGLFGMGWRRRRTA